MGLLYVREDGGEIHYDGGEMTLVNSTFSAYIPIRSFTGSYFCMIWFFFDDLLREMD